MRSVLGLWISLLKYESCLRRFWHKRNCPTSLSCIYTTIKSSRLFLYLLTIENVLDQPKKNACLSFDSSSFAHVKHEGKEDPDNFERDMLLSKGQIIQLGAGK